MSSLPARSTSTDRLPAVRSPLTAGGRWPLGGTRFLTRWLYPQAAILAVWYDGRADPPARAQGRRGSARRVEDPQAACEGRARCLGVFARPPILWWSVPTSGTATARSTPRAAASRPSTASGAAVVMFHRARTGLQTPQQPTPRPDIVREPAVVVRRHVGVDPLDVRLRQILVQRPHHVGVFEVLDLLSEVGHGLIDAHHVSEGDRRRQRRVRREHPPVLGEREHARTRRHRVGPRPGNRLLALGCRTHQTRLTFLA